MLHFFQFILLINIYRTLIVIQDVKAKIQIEKFGETLKNLGKLRIFSKIRNFIECENTTIEMTIFDANGKKLFIDFDFINPNCEINIFSHLVKDTKVIFS